MFEHLLVVGCLVFFDLCDVFEKCSYPFVNCVRRAYQRGSYPWRSFTLAHYFRDEYTPVVCFPRLLLIT